ncbi:MAG TPA: S1 RNA-binding domain-containing protein, partial [bacterium]|nr:S1 RNA-binding domain-containing protein [bacterium]
QVPEPGRIIKGKVINISPSGVFVDVGCKSEGLIAPEEFLSPDGDISVSMEQEIDVFLEKIQAGTPLLSFKKAQKILSWKKLEEAFDKSLPLNVRVCSEQKGGYQVLYMKETGFLPFSETVHPATRRPEPVLNRDIPVAILRVESRKQNYVVSRRLYLQEELQTQKKKFWQTHKEGDLVKGTVSRIMNFGAFVNLGCIEGLIHKNDITWGQLETIDTYLKEGEEVEAKIIYLDQEKEKVGLGIKHLTPHPWEMIGHKIHAGSVVSGKVIQLRSKYAVVEIEKGIEGIVLVEDVSYVYVEDLQKKLKLGDWIRASVVELDNEKRRLRLSIKKMQENPWMKLKEKYRPGDRVLGTVSGISSLGLFIEIEEGVEGFVRKPDISWTSAQNERRFNAGDKIETVLLSLDAEKERLLLSIKETQENPFEKYRPRQNLKVIVTSVQSSFCFVEVEKGISGRIHISQVDQNKIDSIGSLLKPGDEIWVKVVSVNQKERMLELSRRQYLKEQDRQELAKYMGNDEVKFSLKEILQKEDH